jgi:hypothetical protein
MSLQNLASMPMPVRRWLYLASLMAGFFIWFLVAMWANAGKRVPGLEWLFLVSRRRGGGRAPLAAS